MDISAVKADLAPSGTLRAAINFDNTLLASKDAVSGEPGGVSVELAGEVACRLGVDGGWDAPHSLRERRQRRAASMSMSSLTSSPTSGTKRFIPKSERLNAARSSPPHVKRLTMPTPTSLQTKRSTVRRSGR